jgi:hypothetical protein
MTRPHLQPPHPGPARFWTLLLGFFLGALVGLSGCGLVRYAPATHDILAEGALRPPAAEVKATRTPAPSPDHPTLAEAYQQLKRLATSQDRLEQRLGQALARLPDLGDGLTPDEAGAVVQAANAFKEMDGNEKKRLAAILDDRAGSGLLGVALQGGFWMIQNGRPARSALGAYRPEELKEYAWSELLRRLKTPQQVLEFMTTNFIYRLDPDQVQSSRRFFESRLGDCSEYSLLAGHLLAGLGLEVQVLLLKPTIFFGHVAVIYKDERGFWLMDASRVALARILSAKAGALGPVDRLLWTEVRGFDGLFGPNPTPDGLVRHYRPAGRTDLPHKLLPYEVYRQYVETHGAEADAWFRF